MALAECRQALDLAERQPPSMAASRSLALACTALVADQTCRELLRSRLVGKPVGAPWQTAQTCADLYCPRFEPQLAARMREACDAPLPVVVEDFGPVNALLRAGMLAHDFAGNDVQGAVEAWVAVAHYVSRLPPPSGVGLENRAALQVVLTPDGTMTVHGPGIDLSAKSLEELARVTPRAVDEDASITIVASSGVQYSQVIALMDALRDLGYENVQFGQPR